jgi:side tail fiber protein|nr:MAG TPA: hypothetical protein [Caudoviricetes sp.]
MNVIHSVEDNNSQIIHVLVNSNDRGATGEKGDSVTNLRITEENRLEATLSNGQTIDGGAVPAIKTRRVFVADMDGAKRTYILPLNIESSQVSYILMNGVAYSDGYILQSGEITLNYDDLPAGRLEVVLNDNSGHVGDINVSINGKTGDIKLKTINGANLDGDGDIEVATLDAFNNEVRAREEANNNIRNSLNDHEARISNNESTISTHGNNLSSLNANISSVNSQMTTLANDVHEVTDNYVPKTRRINDKFLSHDMRLTADDVEALPITAGVAHPVRGELVVNGHITAENATQDNHVVTKAQLDAKVAEVVNSAPETLDTLEELSKALGDDPNFATTVANRIGTVDKKIDTETNKLANKVEANTEDLKTTKGKANANSTNISLLNSTVATNKLSSDTQFSNVAKEQTDQDTLISDILNAFSKESEKGTNLKLNTSATKVLGVTIYGNTEQAKYTGKNLLRLSTNPTISNGLASTVSPDGLVKYSGKITDSWGDITTLLYFPTPLPAGKYTFLIDHPRAHRIIFKYRLADGSFSEIIANMTATSTSNTFTTTQPIVAGYLYIAAANNSSLDDTVKAQLEIGDTATDYEPYTGGYNNLFDEFSGLPVSKNGLKLENVNGVLKFTGMPTTDWNTMISRDITAVLSDKASYTVVQYNTYGHKLYPAIVAYRADGSGSDEINAINSKTFVFRVDKTKYNGYVMKLQVATRASFSEPVTIYNNYALFQGNYDENNPPEYSPYNTPLASPRPQLPQVVRELSGGKVKVISKNLLKVNNLTSTQTQAVVVVNPDNSITVSDENKNNWGMNFTNDEACPRIEQGTKVTMSIDRPLPYKLILSCWTNTGGPSFQFPLAIINAGSTTVTNVAQYDALSGHLLLSLSQIGKQINETFKVQLEYGDTATKFVPHESAQFTFPSGLNLYKLTDTIYDEVKLENGVAKMIKRVGKLELSGEEEFRSIQAVNPGQYYVFSRVLDKLANTDVSNFICSHFDIFSGTLGKGTLAQKSLMSLKLIQQNDIEALRFMFSAPDALNLKITNVASFKYWLKSEKAKGTPVTIYCEMKTPTEEEITDPTLLAQLKKLMEMRTYDGLTSISVTGTDLTPEIKVKYMRKIGE